MATTRIQIGPADLGRTMTLEEFREAEEKSGYLYELARRVLEVTEVPGLKHWRILDNLQEALSLYRREHPGIVDLVGHGSEVRFLVPELGSDRHPDIGVVLPGASSDDRGRPRPVLAIEIVSPGKAARDRDYVAKREEYLAIGLREYWIIDPKPRRVTVLIRRDGADGPAWEERAFRGEEAIGSELLTGFAGTVNGLWVGLEPEP